jgi:hypothetical protein
MNLIKLFVSTRQVILLTALFITTGISKAQNVGIGLTNPPYRFTVAADINGNGITQNGSGTIGFHTDATWGGTLKTLNNSSLGFITNNSSSFSMIISTAKNVGIGLGVNLPEYKLDIGGRVRLQHNTTLNETAGYWLDGTTAGPRSFVGTIDDNHIGIWGNTGAGWNIAMNVNNGNTGIGTSSPTARLDINGSIRLRNANPKTGSVLISSDANGNAIWQSAAAFHVSGTNNGPLPVPANTWTKFYFDLLTEYNAGLTYEPINSQFVAPYKGIYHFTGQVTLFFDKTQTQGITLKSDRLGIITTLATKLLNHGAITVSGSQHNNTNMHSMDISTDVLLEPGDKVWLEVYHGDATYSNGYKFYDWFTGTLISRL